MKKTEKDEARAFVLRVGMQRAGFICDALRDACNGPDYEQATRIGTTAIEAAIAELEK